MPRTGCALPELEAAGRERGPYRLRCVSVPVLYLRRKQGRTVNSSRGRICTHPHRADQEHQRRGASDFGSGHDLTVPGFEPRVGLCADSWEPGARFGFCVSLSLSAPSPLVLCLSLSLKNE